MTQGDFIRMAREAGMGAAITSEDGLPKVWGMPTALELERFAALVAAAERKACVEACKEQRLLLVEDEAKYASLGIAMCVDAIKTRGIK